MRHFVLNFQVLSVKNIYFYKFLTTKTGFENKKYPLSDTIIKKHANTTN